MQIHVYRDTPKRGETDAKWCWYISIDGHVRQGGTNCETREDATEAAKRAAGVK